MYILLLFIYFYIHLISCICAVKSPYHQHCEKVYLSPFPDSVLFVRLVRLWNEVPKKVRQNEWRHLLTALSLANTFSGSGSSSRVRANVEVTTNTWRRRRQQQNKHKRFWHWPLAASSCCPPPQTAGIWILWRRRQGKVRSVWAH